MFRCRQKAHSYHCFANRSQPHLTFRQPTIKAFMSCWVLWANDWIPRSPQLWEASSSLTQIRTCSSRLGETWELDVLSTILHAHLLLFFPSYSITATARFIGFWRTFSLFLNMIRFAIRLWSQNVESDQVFTICWSFFTFFRLNLIVLVECDWKMRCSILHHFAIHIRLPTFKYFMTLNFVGLNFWWSLWSILDQKNIFSESLLKNNAKYKNVKICYP